MATVPAQLMPPSSDRIQEMCCNNYYIIFAGDGDYYRHRHISDELKQIELSTFWLPPNTSASSRSLTIITKSLATFIGRHDICFRMKKYFTCS
jgi:hypothetical protein